MLLMVFFTLYFFVLVVMYSLNVLESFRLILVYMYRSGYIHYLFYA